MATWIARNGYLSETEMSNNAKAFYSIAGKEWTLNAVAAVCGNMESESGINPGIWENLQPYVGGYGLTQWTPYTKYSEWAGAGWENNGDKETERIMYEAATNQQWFYNSELDLAPPISFTQFTMSTLDVETLAFYFLAFYEHPADPNATRNDREQQARKWYNILLNEPIPPKHGKLPIWLLFKLKEINNGFT